MALNPKFKGRSARNYGPQADDVTATLTLNNGGAPTITEAQGLSYTSRTGTGDYTLQCSVQGMKNAVPQVTVESATLGIAAQVHSVNLTTGAVRVLVFTTNNVTASEVTGTKVHLLMRVRSGS